MNRAQSGNVWAMGSTQAERSGVAQAAQVGHASVMPADATDPLPIPTARCDDLDPDRPEDEEEWERRLMTLATARITAERARLEKLGIIDRNGNVVSTTLPMDMLPESDTTLETG